MGELMEFEERDDLRLVVRLPNGSTFYGTKEQLEIVLANMKKDEEKRTGDQEPQE